MYTLPQIFKDKIDLDNEIKELKKQSVISLEKYEQLQTQQRLTRYSCHNFIKRQRGDRDGGGTPVAGMLG